MKHAAAVVLTTYNNPRFLGICLESLLHQARADFDVWIADDGSSEPTRTKIAELLPRFAGRLHHVWHPDEGYRKSQINNEVLRRMEKEGRDYATLIFIDHDTIAHPRFVEDHLSVHAKDPRAVFMGRRVDLDAALSDSITEENVRDFARGLSPRLLVSGLLGRSSNVFRALRVSNPALQKLLGRNRVPDLLGSNFSAAASLIKEVNGFNEELQAYWGEDGDLFVRLRNVGARLVGKKGFAVQYHLFHKRLVPDPQQEARYAKILSDRDYKRCAHGIRPN